MSKCRVLNLRMVSVTPLKLHGGMTAATRLPSGRRESRMGFDSEMSSPRRRAMFFTATMRAFSPRDMPCTCWRKPASLDEDPVRAVHHDLADRIVENEVLDGFQERKDHFESVHQSSPPVIRDLLEIGFVGVVEVGLQVAECRRHGIEAVVGDGNGLRVLEFGEGLHVETEVGVGVVALRGGNVGLVRDGLAGEQADTRVVAALGKVVADLELVFPSAELACGAGREVVRERQEISSCGRSEPACARSLRAARISAS